MAPIVAVRGLAAGKTIMMYGSMRTMTRIAPSRASSTTGVRGLIRAVPRRALGQSTISSVIRAMIQQRTREAYARSKQVPSRILQHIRTRLFHTTRAPRYPASPNPNPTSNLGSPNENLTLGQRMRKLSREYGWSALGVYLALSALDFPFCYLLVRYLGTDMIGEWEHVAVSSIQRLIPESVKAKWHEWRVSVKQALGGMTGKEPITDHAEMAGWGVEEAQEQNQRYASLATQLALAYAIHKSFIFIRVPLAAAITPKVVKILRGWGWDIGKRTTKEARAIKRSLVGKPATK